MSSNTAWFASRGWGVFCHYLGAAPSSDGGAELTSEEWNRRVDAFDVKALAAQLARTQAGYFFITVGQNSGHYLAPNKAYDSYVGIEPSKCSRRDLIADLYEVLEPEGIALLVYIAAGAPAAEPVAVDRLEWEWGFEGDWPGSWGAGRTGKRLTGFQRKWEAVNREWSVRWGNKVRGWWVDGCYFADEMYRHADEPNFQSFTAALKAGNSDAIVAYNPGVKTPIIAHTKYEDYTAGEIARALPECPGAFIELDGAKIRYHILSYLGDTWCSGSPRFPDELAIAYTNYIIGNGGVITWDVPIEESGRIPETFVDQLAAIGAGIHTR